MHGAPSKTRPIYEREKVVHSLDDEDAQRHPDAVGMYRLTICVTPEDRETLGRMAARYDVTISGVIRRLVRDAQQLQPAPVPAPAATDSLDRLEAEILETLRTARQRQAQRD